MEKNGVSPQDRHWIISKGREARETGKPVYLETRQDAGQAEPFPRYLIWCPDCREFSVSQPGGRYGRLACRYRRIVYGRLRPKPSDEARQLRLILRLGGIRLLVLIVLLLTALIVLKCSR